MEWLDSVLGKGQSSNREEVDNGTGEEQVEIVRVNDYNVLFTNLGDMVNELKSIKQGPTMINQEEMKEYKKFMSNLLPKKSSGSSRNNKLSRHRNKMQIN